MKPNKTVIGLTGTIASGKSTAARYFQETYKVPHVDADIVGHEVLKEASVRDRLVEAFGNGILTEGEIDRKKLGALVFEEEGRVELLNHITHPVICARVQEKVNEFLQGPCEAPLMIIEAYGLLQSDLKNMVSQVWAVGCDKKQRCRRVMERQGLTEEEAYQRIQGQWPDEKYRELADVYLDGSGSVDLLKSQCDILWKRFS